MKEKIILASMLLTTIMTSVYGASEVKESQRVAPPSVAEEYAYPYPEDIILRDGSDAPASYGEISIEMAKNFNQFGPSFVSGDWELWAMENPTTTAQNNSEGLFLGYDAPDADDGLGTISGDSANTDDELGNERGVYYPSNYFYDYWSLPFVYYDDETGFNNLVQNNDGELEVNFNEDKLYLRIPYVFSNTMMSSTTDRDDYDNGTCYNDYESWFGSDEYMPCEMASEIPSARLLIWIDTDLSGTFDEDEGILLDESVITKYPRPQLPESGTGVEALFKNLEVEYDFSSLTSREINNLNENGTYMRLVLTSDSTYGLDDAAKNPASTSVGEIEDYRLVSNQPKIKDGACSYAPGSATEMIPTSVDTSKVDLNELTFKGIDNIYTEDDLTDTFDVKFTISGNDPVDYSIINYTKENEVANVSVAYEKLNVVDFLPETGSPARFKFEFTDSATGAPVEIPLELTLNDLDGNVWLKFDQNIISSKNEKDSYYRQFEDNYIVFDIDDPAFDDPIFDFWGTSFNVNSALSEGSSQKATVSFNPTSEISGMYSSASAKEGVVDDYGWSSQGIGFSLKFGAVESIPDCKAPVYSVDKTSTPVGDATQVVEPGDTINYQVAVTNKEDTGLGVVIKDPLDSNLSYVDGSAELTLISGGVDTDVTDKATINFDEKSNELIVTVDEFFAKDEVLVLDFDTTVGDEEGPYTITNVAHVSDIKETTTYDTPMTKHLITAEPAVSVSDYVMDEVLVGSGFTMTDDEIMAAMNLTINDSGVPTPTSEKAADTTVELSSSETEIKPLDIDYTVPGDYTVYYHVTNSIGLKTVVSGTFTVNDLLPVINVKTPSIKVKVASEPLDLISDFGVTSTEIEEGDLTTIVSPTSSVDYNTVGTYPVDYTVTDDEGNIATNKAQIIVTSGSTSAPELTISNAEIDEQLVGAEKPLTNDELLELLEFEVISTGTDSEDVTVSISSSATDIEPLDIDYSAPADYDVYVHVTNSEDETAVVHGVLTIKDLLPVITVGTPEITVKVGSDKLDLITDFDVNATEIEENDVTSDIVATSPVDYNTAGTYNVSYTVTDDEANEATNSAKIIVVDEETDIVTPPTSEVDEEESEVGTDDDKPTDEVIDEETEIDTEAEAEVEEEGSNLQNTGSTTIMILVILITILGGLFIIKRKVSIK